MKVILADILGYCMGVRCAMEKAENALEKFEGKNVYSLGPLIHNENALNSLKQKGLKILSENDFKNAEDYSVVIIRAHGVSPEVLKVLEETMNSAEKTEVKDTARSVKALITYSM